MSTRNLTGGMSERIADGVVRPVLFLEGSFYATGSPDEEFLRLWTGIGEVSWSGRSWTGAGKLLRLSPLEESNEVKAVGFSVELSGLPASTLSLALANTRQGRPGKVWLGLMGREGYLDLPGIAGNYAGTPDSAAVSITGDIDIRVKLAKNNWASGTVDAFIGKWQAAGGTLSYAFYMATSNVPSLLTSSNGTNQIDNAATAVTGFANGTANWLRVTLDVDNGAGGRTAIFYTSSDGVKWSQLGTTVTTAATTSIYDSAAILEVGSFLGGTANLLAGKIHYAEIRNGIDGPVVAKFDPSVDAHSWDASFTSSYTGELWTINSSGSPTECRIVVAEDQIIADPYLIRSGRMDYVTVSADGQNTVITAQYEGRLIDLERARERRYTDEDQQYEYSGDGGFRFVSALQDKQLVWGGPAAASSPLATPEPDSEEPQSRRGRRDRGGDDY